MDSDTSSALSLGSIIISVLGSVIALVNHKRIRSNCCGAKTEVSLDIESTTPPELKKEAFDLEKKEDDKK
jgi:hypothetical protein